MMKYTSIDHFSDFEFHDAKIRLISFVNDHLLVEAKYLNIHKNAEQNPFETDMEIACARIGFEGFHIVSYKPDPTWKTAEKGKPVPDEPQVIFCEAEALRRFLAQLKMGISIFDFDTTEANTYFIDALTSNSFFTVCFIYDRLLIEWDNYKGEAWYTQKGKQGPFRP